MGRKKNKDGFCLAFFHIRKSCLLITDSFPWKPTRFQDVANLITRNCETEKLHNHTLLRSKYVACLVIFASREVLHCFRHQNQVFENLSQSNGTLENLLHWRFQWYIFLKIFVVYGLTENVTCLSYFVRMLWEIQICYW